MKRSYRLVIGLIAVVGAFCLTEPVLAGPLEDGLAAYRRGDYATALSLLKPLAEQSDPLGQAQLGIMYAEGEGVAQDYVQAYMWLHLAGTNSSDYRVLTFEIRDRFAAKMTPEQIAEAQGLATDWKPKGE